jgi:transposase-like protein
MEKILSFFDFQKQFPDEEACYNYLVKVKWPNGYTCPKCSHNQYYKVKRRKLFQCKQCGHQASVTAGTVFHKLRHPLLRLFWAAFLMASSKKGISALELQRKLNIRSYQTAWLLEHKLRKAMVSSGKFPLKIMVETDETYVGGAQEGKAGRGARGKSLVAGAVEVNPETEAMGRAYLQKIQTHSTSELGAFINNRVAKGTKVKTDGLPSYNFLDAEYEHITTKAKDVDNKGELLPKVHIVIANLKMWLRGTFNRYPEKHIQSYLDEYAFRFNRRWKIDSIFDKLLNRCISTTTITYAELTG